MCFLFLIKSKKNSYLISHKNKYKMITDSKCRRAPIILSFLMITLSLVSKNPEAARDRGARCEKPDYIPNGSYRMRRDRVMRISCNLGFLLQGPKTIDCIRGKWDGEKPVCAKKGCSKDLKQPENGRIQIESDLKAILYCSDNYNLAGNRHSYCNGSHWDRPIGNCRERKNVIQHECDFETDDICGWTYDQREGLEWKRVMAANVFTTFKTGPRHDHTTLTANGGHYMLMESLTRLDDDVTLTSPIYDRALSLKTACCFQFFYFMYGAGVGDLFVVVKPISLGLNDLMKTREDLIKFKKYGNQNNIWNEAHFNIEELEEDFQILFIAKSGRGQLSDIAVDDVKLLTGDDCRALDNKEDEDLSNEEYSTSKYESIFEMQSCVGRCFEASGSGIVHNPKSGHLLGLCNCDTDCEDSITCCPDFRTVCLIELFAQSTPDSEVEETTLKIERRTTPTTTTTTSTTIKATSTTMKTTPTTTTATTITKTTPTTTFVAPITIKTTRSTTTSITPKTTTIKTTKATTKLTTTTRKTTPSTTTIKTTPTTTTIKTTTKTTPKTATTVKTTTPTIMTTPTLTTTRSTTPSNIRPQEVTSTRRPIPSSKSIEYIINDKSKTDSSQKGLSSLVLLYTFIIIVVFILAAVVYKHYGDKAVAWYMIRFKQNSNGDEDSSSITTSFKRPQANGGNDDRNSKSHWRNKIKKSSSARNPMKTPLVNDDEDDDDIGAHGNIALKNKIYTEL